MTYQYRVDGLQKVPAQVAGEMCASLERSAQGLTAKTLLDANRPENAPLHGEYEWNDTVAAENYRLTQSKGIIRNIVLVRTEVEEPEPIRAFVNVVTPEARSYKSIVRVMGDEDLREQLFESAKREMRAFTDKYKTLDRLAGVLAAMNPLLD